MQFLLHCTNGLMVCSLDSRLRGNDGMRPTIRNPREMLEGSRDERQLPPQFQEKAAALRPSSRMFRLTDEFVIIAVSGVCDD